MTSCGFYSVVVDPEDSQRLVVRARVRHDLVRLRRYLPTLTEIERTPDRDYEFRARCQRSEWAAAAGKLANEISYENFKGHIAKTDGHERELIYSLVWANLRRLAGLRVRCRTTSR